MSTRRHHGSFTIAAVIVMICVTSVVRRSTTLFVTSSSSSFPSALSPVIFRYSHLRRAFLKRVLKLLTANNLPASLLVLCLYLAFFLNNYVSFLSVLSSLQHSLSPALSLPFDPMLSLFYFLTAVCLFLMCAYLCI